MGISLQTPAKIAAGVAGVYFPIKSLYNSTQEDRTGYSAASHLAAASVVGLGVGYGGNIGIDAIASSIAKGSKKI